MISRLPIIAHCIETDFRYLADPQYYTQRQTHTTHYHEGTTPIPLHICRETIYENHYYETQPQTQTQTTKIPAPLSRENGDTYASQCAINHRNIYDPKTQEDYQRCIARWKAITHPQTQTPVIGLYIHPTITEAEYDQQSLIAEFETFQKKSLHTWKAVMYFVIVRTAHPYPITNHVPQVIETVVDTPETRIAVVYTNRDFVDAGEIFMQNAYIETDRMCLYIQEYLKYTEKIE